jgi:putative ABC transport system substrate-binding protein
MPGLGALAAAAPLRLGAQESKKTRTIGVLALGHPPTAEQNARFPFAAMMKKHGWVEGTDFVMERRYAELKGKRLAAFAEALVRRRVDLILTSGPEATLAAARATQTIPILFSGVFWPVEQGLIDSFARPGRNVTGIASYTGVEVSNKRLEFLREIAPAAKRLAWLWPTEFAETVSGGQFDIAPVMEAAARSLGFDTRFNGIRKAEDIEAALNDLLAWRAQAITASGVHVSAAAKRIAEFALRERSPSAFPSLAIVEAGGLLFYLNSPAELPQLYARWVSYADRILRGAQPGEFPVERPSQYELVINLKTAKALGLSVPQSLLIRADRVIK